jgi:parallel beta-helix repeat protein
VKENAIYTKFLTPSKYDKVDYTRSYTISDDALMPIPDGSSGNHNNIPKKDLITADYRNENGSYFYRIVEGSLAKDAIPFGDDSNPFNGAPLLDQRGFNVWNQSKDIGAYESPYYWVDVANEEQYRTIPNWKTELMIADTVEYNDASPEEKWKWTDYMKAQTGGRIIFTENSEIIREEGSELKWLDGSFLDVSGNSKIINGSNFFSNASVDVYENKELSLQNTKGIIPTGASFKIGDRSKFIIENGSDIVLTDGLIIEIKDNAEIIVKNKGCLSTDGINLSYTGSDENSWNGISCAVGSQLNFSNSTITGAHTGISGAPISCRITNSSFLNCENGISLINCPDYSITNNRLIGKGLNSYGYAQGVGITLTSCSMPISENTVQNYAEGMKLISSSITLAKNKLTNNFNSGLLITGNGSKPVLVNSLVRDLIPRLNNEIYGNNIDYTLYNGAQIYMRYSAGAYMTGGYNNIYSGLSGVVPSVPCIRGIINTLDPTPVINKVLIAAERNYWGYDRIDEVNQPDFFFFRHSTYDIGYSIDFDPYAIVPYTADGSASTDLNTNEPRSTEATMLLNAMKLEDTGSSKASIKLYENIIKKYPMTPEYYVAESRLPGLYIEEDIPLTALLSSFDEAIENETVLGKKFFKGLRVSTHIKAKNYDTAIMYAEEMKNEAETDEEALLSEIDIAVANMMKEAEGKGKSGNSSDQLEKLLEMLNGKEPESSPADIVDNNLPSRHELYQNYPNPFNPVTQIRFALAKTANVKLNVYNIAGQKVAELANGTKNTGYHSAAFDGSRFNSGVYYYSLEIDGKNITKKMVLTK